MSLLDIARSRGRHRGLTLAELRAELVATRRQKDAATVAAIKYATEATELQQQLDAAGITISGLLHDLEQERLARKTAETEGIRLKAALDNATSISVASGTRDIWPGEEPTHSQGINVRTLRAQFAGIDPAHVPAVAG